MGTGRHLDLRLGDSIGRRHIDGVEPGDRILQLLTRCAVDDDARGLQYFHKSLGKVRAEPLQVAHYRSGVLEAFIDVADVSIITDSPGEAWSRDGSSLSQKATTVDLSLC